MAQRSFCWVNEDKINLRCGMTCVVWMSPQSTSLHPCPHTQAHQGHLRIALCQQPAVYRLASLWPAGVQGTGTETQMLPPLSVYRASRSRRLIKGHGTHLGATEKVCSHTQPWTSFWGDRGECTEPARPLEAEVLPWCTENKVLLLFRKDNKKLLKQNL